MADSLLDLYLGSGKKSEPEKEKSGSLIDIYLGPTSNVEQAVTPITEENRVIAPPRSGYTEEQSQAQLRQPAYKEPSLASKAGSAAMALPTEYAGNVAKNYKSGVETAMSGLQDIGQNNPATGVGKVGLGALGAVASPITGVFSTIGDEATKITGSRQIGDKVELIAGAGLPVAKAGQAVKATMPTNKAISAIVDTIGKENLAPVIQELKSNERLSLMDVVPATRQMAQKLITNEGPHQNKFEKFVQERIATGKGATAEIYDTTMGVPVNIVEKLDKFKKDARAVGKKEIEPALKGSGFVDVSGVINNIDAKLKPGVNSIITAGEPLALGDIEKPLAAVRKFIMDDKSVRTDPKSLHQFQSALRAKADDLLNSQSGQDRQQGHALMKVRNDIVEAIDKASGGTYKPALAKYKDEMDIQNAFNMGQLVTRNKLGRLEDSPEFWNKWVKGASKEELEAAREGARLAVQHQIGGFKAGARKGQDIVESEFNREKLTALFGKEEVDQMAKLLKDERNIAITNSKLIDNSQTAMRMKADSRVDLPVERGSGLGAIVAPIAELAVASATGYPGASGVVLASQLGSKLKHKASTSLAKRRNVAVTDLLTAVGEDRAELIRILESHIPQAPKLSLANRLKLSLPTAPP